MTTLLLNAYNRYKNFIKKRLCFLSKFIIFICNVHISTKSLNKSFVHILTYTIDYSPPLAFEPWGRIGYAIGNKPLHLFWWREVSVRVNSRVSTNVQMTRGKFWGSINQRLWLNRKLSTIEYNFGHCHRAKGGIEMDTIRVNLISLGFIGVTVSSNSLALVLLFLFLFSTGEH